MKPLFECKSLEEFISQKKWNVNDKGYLRCQIKRKEIRQHKLIVEEILQIKLPQGLEIHHKDGNKLNNDPFNLIICTHLENLLYDAKPNHACWDKHRNKWMGYFAGKTKRFDNKQDAINWRNEKIKEAQLSEYKLSQQGKLLTEQLHLTFKYNHLDRVRTSRTFVPVCDMP